MISGFEEGDTLLEKLVYAINSQDLNKVKEILKQGGFDINEEVYKTRALVFAVEESTIEIIRELIKNGADVNLPGFEGHTALYDAILQQWIPVVKLLLENGADVNQTSPDDEGEETPLALALQMGHDVIAKLLLAQPNIQIDDKSIDMIDDTTLEIQYLIFEKLRPLEERKIAKNNATNILSMQNIETGTNMINFHDEFKHGRYYTKNTFNRLPIKNVLVGNDEYMEAKENPTTRQAIDPVNIRRYKAVVSGGGAGKRGGKGGARTRRKRGSKRKTRRGNRRGRH
jgi:ankyrin repeat protein